MKLFKKWFFKYLASDKKSWHFFIKELFTHPAQSIEILCDWEKFSSISFNTKKYSQLLQLSLFKNNHLLSIYLLETKDIVLPHEDLCKEDKIFTKSILLDKLMNDDILQKDYAVWLGLMACHHPFHLICLKKRYNSEDYYQVAQSFFLHPKFKDIYLDKERQNIILSLCHEKAKNMLRSIFIELSLGIKDNSIIKVQKI